MCRHNFEWPDIDYCYSEPVAYGDVPGVGLLLAGDVDRDGHLDVVVPGAAGGSAAWPDGQTWTDADQLLTMFLQDPRVRRVDAAAGDREPRRRAHRCDRHDRALARDARHMRSDGLASARGFTLADLNEDGLSDFVYVPLDPPHALSVRLSP